MVHLSAAAKVKKRTPALSADRAAGAVLAALLGVFLLYGAGFAQSHLLHDAAHDSRHGLSFPCH